MLGLNNCASHNDIFVIDDSNHNCSDLYHLGFDFDHESYNDNDDHDNANHCLNSGYNWILVDNNFNCSNDDDHQLRNTMDYQFNTFI